PREAVTQAPPLQQPHEAVHAVDPRLELPALGLERGAAVRESAQLVVDRVEAPLTYRERGLVDLRPFALLALQLQLLAELHETLGRDAPEVTQLEVHDGVRRVERIDQEPLEAVQLLLCAQDLAFVVLELVEHRVALTAKLAQLAFDGRAV